MSLTLETLSPPNNARVEKSWVFCRKNIRGPVVYAASTFPANMSSWNPDGSISCVGESSFLEGRVASEKRKTRKKKKKDKASENSERQRDRQTHTHRAYTLHLKLS